MGHLRCLPEGRLAAPATSSSLCVSVALPSAHYGCGPCGWHPLTGIEIPSEETLMEHILTASHPGTNPAAPARGLLARLARQISGMIARGRSRRGIDRKSVV